MFPFFLHVVLLDSRYLFYKKMSANSRHFSIAYSTAMRQLPDNRFCTLPFFMDFSAILHLQKIALLQKFNDSIKIRKKFIPHFSIIYAR